MPGASHRALGRYDKVLPFNGVLSNCLSAVFAQGLCQEVGCYVILDLETRRYLQDCLNLEIEHLPSTEVHELDFLLLTRRDRESVGNSGGKTPGHQCIA